MTQDIIFIPVPKGSINLRVVYRLPHGFELAYDNNYKGIWLTPGQQYEFICLLSQATEEQAKTCVEDESGMDDTGAFEKITRLESLHSLASSKGFYLSNSLGERPLLYDEDHGNEEKMNKYYAWNEAQSKVHEELAVLKIVRC